ncbi:MAG TPA: DUF333 domain-containing protein [bacterium]|nr:DUF333 domain-containing protein [bacterium]
MKKMILFFIVLILIIVGFVLSSIYSKKENMSQVNQEELDPIKQELNETLQGDNTQIANPASVYCIERGGKSEMITDESTGTIGYCVFNDGSSCEEWAFYRSECVPGQIK